VRELCAKTRDDVNKGKGTGSDEGRETKKRKGRWRGRVVRMNKEKSVWWVKAKQEKVNTKEKGWSQSE